MLRKLIASLCLSALLACPADAVMGTRRVLLSDGGVKPFWRPTSIPYLGNVATNTFLASAQNGSNFQLMSRKVHRASDVISSLQLVLPNWFVSSGGNEVEVPSGGTVTFTASIEYPTGTFRQVLFGGLTIATVLSGNSVISDAISVSIPFGAQFFTRIWMSTTAGIFWQSVIVANTAAGEALTIGAASVADQTMGGTVVANVNGIFSPVAVLGITRKPTIVLMGDSRTYGVGDTYDASGDIGQIARSLGASNNVNYLNLSMSGGRADTWLGGASRRVSLTNTYGTHIIEAHGINVFDLPGGTPTYEATQLSSIKALFPTLPMFAVTCFTHSASTDGWATIVNQSQGPNPSNRIGWNDNLRSGAYASTFAGYFEVADQVESATDSGLWQAPSYTGDGLHGTQLSYIKIKNSGVIPK